MIAHAIPAPELPAIRATGYDPAALYTARETAALLRISMSHLRRLRLDGHGPRCIWLSTRKPVYRAIDLQVWLTERALHQSTPAA